LLWPALDNSIEGSELGTPIRSRCGRCCGKCFTAQRRRCRFHIMWHRHIAMHHSAVVEVPQHTHPPEVHVLWPAMMAEAEGGGRTRAHSPGPRHPEPADVAASRSRAATWTRRCHIRLPFLLRPHRRDRVAMVDGLQDFHRLAGGRGRCTRAHSPGFTKHGRRVVLLPSRNMMQVKLSEGLQPEPTLQQI